MLAFLADENFNGHLVKALRQTHPEIDVLRVQDAGLSGRSDPEVLEWIAEQERLLLTHDVKTMPGYLWERVTSGLTTPAIVEVSGSISIPQAVEELALLAYCGERDEYRDRVLFIPMR